MPTPAPIPVAILGFSLFERNALASHLRLASNRPQAYQYAMSMDDARFVIADADQSGVLELLAELGRTGDAVFVGARGPVGAGGWMMRPIDPQNVMRALDTLLESSEEMRTAPSAFITEFAPLPPRGLPLPGSLHNLAGSSGGMLGPNLGTHLGTNPGTNPGISPLATQARRAADLLDEATAAADAAARASERHAQRRDAAETRRRQREALLLPTPLKRALLVDDSDVALHFLDRLLAPYGLERVWANSSGKALEVLSHQAFGFVFLDIDLGMQSGLDGLSLCQHIKHQHVHTGGTAPMVVLVSAMHEAVDRVRGALAGADSYLGKPLDAAVLHQLLLRHGLNREDGAAPMPPGV